MNIKPTVHGRADIVNDRLAPRSSAVFGVGLDSKFIDCVWLQVVNDRVFSGARLIVPLPVLLPVTHRVVSGQRMFNTNEKVKRNPLGGVHCRLLQNTAGK